MAPRRGGETPRSDPAEPEREVWRAVDRYFVDLFDLDEPVLAEALTASASAGLPDIQVSPLQGRILHLLALLQNARRILEIGTLGGYSTIWLARALPPRGRLVSLELEPRHARVAHSNLKRAGLADRVEIRVGRAIDSLAALEVEGVEPFDFVFIDADKESYPEYLIASLRLSRPGALIVADNVVRNGTIVDPLHPDARVQGIRRFFEVMAAEPRLLPAAIQMVGPKGYDGWAIARVNPEGTKRTRRSGVRPRARSRSATPAGK
jgi:predicted O-methyltransferase YrrM